MNIKYKERQSVVQFINVIVGETFIYNECLYIKIRKTDNDINVFNFTKNYVDSFEDTEPVTLVNMELVEV